MTNIYFQCFVAGLGGIIVQIIIKLIKIQRLRKVNQSSDSPPPPLHIGNYFKTDYLYLVLSLVAVLLALLVMDSFMGYKIRILNNDFVVSKIIKVLFILWGYTGASILSFALNNTEKKILSIISKKTDIANEQTATSPPNI